ncbi:hypothetical protein [Wenzhouxiangella marina]|uniref:Uncharacterized protein n=1 Tax=Wenzhouxiangella marina TaxID=1579979 RepID=A0A0K0XV56_9GAMM|nr:hypothetical protein [Wenzhouxiangella marina]AKS41507.1 hypothetical protein WM2015_1133 [Wenzhouxiangella marina]MBB6086734.1 tetratricopeptide (TPR) repeat protein [Wenzhouxiangella marina]
MTLSRIKAHAQAQAVRRFTNRESAKTAFSKALESCLQERNQLRLLMFYGLGGIGKSSLLKHLREKARINGDTPTAAIDLEAAHYSSQLDYLLDIRRQLKVDAPLFDYAVARFITVSGRTLKEIDQTWVPADSLLYDLQEVACDMIEVVAPARLVSRLWARLNQERKKRLGALREAFIAIDELEDEALAEHLPYYLGQALEASNDKTRSSLVVFVDSLECLSSRRYYRLTKEAPDAWLRELIASTGTGLWVIAGRNRITWSDDQPEWDDFLDQHLVGPLDDADADGFLKGIPIKDKSIRQAIVRTAKGVPLYLDLCASTFIMRSSNGEPLRASDFEVPEQEVIRRFLAHLEPEQREAVRTLSLVRVFDRGLFSALNRALNIGIPDTLFEAFCGTAYIAPARENDPELHSVHRLVRSYVAPRVDKITRTTVAEVLITEAAAAMAAADEARSIRLLGEFVRIGVQAEVSESDTMRLALLDTATGLIDRGHWVAVEDALSILAEGTSSSSSMAVALAFLRGLCARKRGALNEAVGHYATAEESAFRLGRYQPLLEYHMAHARHLNGEYEAAWPVYERLSRPTEDRPAAVMCLAKRQRADLAMLRGDFRVAMQAFDGLIGVMPSDPLWDAETHRFRGHVRRFNFHLDEAEACYAEARRIAESMGADAMLGKILTNLAETRCWCRPLDALADADAAIELNREVKAPIEVGKALAAKAVALARNGQPDLGLAAARESLACQQKTGYRAGTLFARLAEGISHAAAGNRAGVESALAIIERESRILTVYGFLAQPLRQILAGPADCLPSEYAWLGPDTATRMVAALPLLR